MKFDSGKNAKPDQQQRSAPPGPAPTTGAAPSTPAAAPTPTPAPAPAQHTQAPPAQGMHSNNSTFHQSNTTFKSNTMSQNTGAKPSLIRGAVHAPVSRNNSSMAMDNIRKAMEELGISNEFEDYIFKFIELDTSGNRRKVAALVVAVRSKSVQDSPVAYHSILLEETGTMQRVKRRCDSVTYDDELYASDGFDQYMREDVIKAVAGQFFPGGQITYNKETNETSVNGIKLISAMASTIPSTVDLKVTSSVRGPLSNACIAAMTLLNQDLGRGDDLQLVGNVSGQRWTAHTLISNASFADMTGTPNRGELAVEIKEGGSDNNQNQYDQSYNDPNGEVLTHQILGFMDLVYNPTPAALQMQQQNNMFMPNMIMGAMMGGVMGGMTTADAFRVFMPRYVMTHVDPIYNPTLPDLLFGIAGTNVAILEDGRWRSGLVAQHNLGADNLISGRNMRDLGILGTEVTRPGQGDQTGQMVRSRFATSGGRGEDPVLYSIIDTVIRPEPLLSMHVPESGAYSWMAGYFVAAAMGSQSAQADIISAADYMTRNEFSKIYNQLCGGAPQAVVLNDNVLVNLGRYTDQNGMLRDSRDVDQLVIENAFAETRPDMVDRWIRMQNDVTLPIEFRLSETRAIIRELYSNVQFTGKARAITFNPLFLRALCQAIVVCGGRMHLRTGNENPSSTTRSTASFLNGVQFATGASGFYTPNYHQPQSQTQYGGGGFYGRWGS